MEKIIFLKAFGGIVLQSVFIFSNDKKQLNIFCKNSFNKTFKGKNLFFSYKSLNIHISDVPIDLFSKNSVVIFLDVSKEFEDMYIEKDSLCIVESENHTAMKILAKNKATAIVCGNNKTDTISLSSIKENGIIVCQQRIIKTVYGKHIEPCEFAYNASVLSSIPTVLLSAALSIVIN